MGGNGGDTVTVTAGVPVASPGTVSQSITQTFDPSRVRLTGSTGIIAPTGWTLTYSSDGTTFGSAPNNAAGWAAIRAVRATGSIASGGDANGLQIASGSATGNPPVSQAFSSGGGGDGWDVAFDERGNVYNTFHHDGAWWSGFKTPGVHCHTRTGAVCGPGWPFSLRIPDGTTGPDGITGQPWYHTNDQAMQWVDTVNNRIWIPTTLNDGTAASGNGFVCVDASDLATGPTWCGGGIRNAFVKLANSSVFCNRDCTLGLAAANNLLFAWDGPTGKLLCLDPFASRTGNLPGAPCTGQPYTISGISAANYSNGYSLMAAQGLIWGTAEGSSVARATCFDPVALTACAGWSVGSVALSGTFPNTSFDIPTSTGAPGSVCFTKYAAVRACFAVNGTSTSELTGSYTGSALMAYLSTRLTTTIVPKYAVTTGTRIYWADGAWPGGGKIYCWDMSLISVDGAPCPSWPVNVSAYTATIDAQNPNCIWTNTDSGAITTIDAVTGGSTCTTPPPVAEFSAPLVVPRLACTASDSIQEWRTLKLTAPLATTYSTAKLTVLTSAGVAIPGWSNITIPANTRMVDLSTLAIATSGLSPRFRVSLADKTSTDAISVEVTAVGEAPQLCVPLQTVATCPTAPARIAGSVPAPDAIVVSGTGEAQPQSGSAEQFSPTSVNVTVSGPSDSTCLGTINGVATMASSSTAVAGATVRLIGSNGSVIATTTTDSNGAYSFDRLTAGTGYRVEFGPTTGASADNATGSSASTNRTVTANSATTVNGVYALLRTNALSGSTAHNQPVSLTPAPHNSTGLQDYSSFARSATCVVDPADFQCKSSVTIPGEGLWSTDSSSGAITFTPQSGFVGATTGVVYRVTETSSTWTTWNTATVTVAAAPTTTTPPSIPTTTAPPSTADVSESPAPVVSPPVVLELPATL